MIIHRIRTKKLHVSQRSKQTNENLNGEVDKHSPCKQTIIQQMRPKEVSLAQGHKKQHSQNYIPQTASLERDILSWS